MNNPELIAHLMKSGGHILIVGGGTEDLPRQITEHPQILIWDDNDKNFMSREIPSNTKVIMWNRWTSHSMAAKLNNATRSLHAVKFPMLRPREIKELLSEVIQIDKPEIDLPTEVIEQEIESVNQSTESKIEEIIVAKKIAKSGAIQQLLAKHLNMNVDYSIRGSKTKEGKRLLEIAKKEGIKTTEASLTNALGTLVNNLKKGQSGIKTKKIPGAVSIKVHAPEKSPDVDDFEELERLISDAIVAMKLVQEHLPKVRKETEKLRGMKEKFRKLLE